MPPPPTPNAMERPSITAPKAIANAVSTIVRATAIWSSAIAAARMSTSARTAPLSNRGDGTRALTAASTVARQATFASTYPIARMASATRSRGTNRAKPSTRPWSTVNPSTSTPDNRNPIQTIQKTAALASASAEGRSAVFSRAASSNRSHTALNPTRPSTHRVSHFSMIAMNHPTTMMLSVTTARGKSCATDSTKFVPACSIASKTL